MWERFVTFLKENDINTIADWARSLDWMEVLTNPIVWLVTIVVVVFVIWKKQYKLLILAASCFAFLFLLQSSLPPSEQSIGLTQLLKFLGGATVIIGINIYFFFIRSD